MSTVFSSNTRNVNAATSRRRSMERKNKSLINRRQSSQMIGGEVNYVLRQRGRERRKKSDEYMVKLNKYFNIVVGFDFFLSSSLAHRTSAHTHKFRPDVERSALNDV